MVTLAAFAADSRIICLNRRAIVSLPSISLPRTGELEREVLIHQLLRLAGCKTNEFIREQDSQNVNLPGEKFSGFLKSGFWELKIQILQVVTSMPSGLCGYA